MKLFLLFSLVLSLIGCGTGGGVKYDAASVDKVQRVAIVSFTLLQEAAIKDNPDLKPPPMPGGMKSWTPGINSFIKALPHADQMAKQIKSQLEVQKKWKIMDPDQVKTNAAYVAMFTQKMHNWKNKISPKEDTQFLIVEAMMDYETGRNLSQPERESLMQNLNVDSLAFVKVDVELKSPMGLLNGIGERKPSAKTYLVIYTKGKDYPIWEAWNEVKKPEASIAMTSTGLNQELMNQGSLRSAKKSFDELLTTLEMKKSE